MEKKTKFERLWGQAHNLCSAYDNLRQMRELFDNAKGAEEAVNMLESRKQVVLDELKALDEAKEKLRVRYQVDAKSIRDQADKGKRDMEDLKEKYIKRYESEYGKRVEAAKSELISLADKKMERDKEIESKLSRIAGLNKDIQMKEGQIEAFEDQFKQIQQALT